MGSVKEYNDHFLKSDQSQVSDRFEAQHLPIRLRRIEMTDQDGSAREIRERLLYSTKRLTFKDPFVASDITSDDQFSDRYYNCGGVVVVGYDPVEKKNVNFITHHNPEQLLKNQEVFQAFLSVLSEKMDVILKRSLSGTVDVCLFGGNLFTDAHYEEDYYKMQKTIAHFFKNKYEIAPDYLTGPNLTPRQAHFGFLNSERELCAIVDKQPDENLYAPFSGALFEARFRQWLRRSWQRKQ